MTLAGVLSPRPKDVNKKELILSPKVVGKNDITDHEPFEHFIMTYYHHIRRWVQNISVQCSTRHWDHCVFRGAWRAFWAQKLQTLNDASLTPSITSIYFVRLVGLSGGSVFRSTLTNIRNQPNSGTLVILSKSHLKCLCDAYMSQLVYVKKMYMHRLCLHIESFHDLTESFQSHFTINATTIIV